MPTNPVSLLVMIVLAAFVIDRLVAALLFLLSFSSAWNRTLPEPEMIENPDARRQSLKKQKLIYFVLASLLALFFLLSYREVGVLKALGFQRTEDTAIASSVASSTGAGTPDPNATVTTDPKARSFGDFLLTWLILVGGAENIAKLLKGQGDFGREKTEAQPIEITGKLTLEDHSERRT